MEKIARQIRKIVLWMIYKAQTSHIGSNFSCIDILTAIFEKADFKKDKLIVSKGWAAASVYALAAHHRLIPKEDLETYCKEGSRYIGLIEPLGFFGCEFSGGSMGYGLPAAVGFAMAKKIKREEGRVYMLMSDGEMQCGTTWESALIADHHKLDNLLVVVDCNDLQAMGKIQDILSLRDLTLKWRSFNWRIHDIDGHDIDMIEYILNLSTTGPTILLAHTIKGKGVSFMEDNNEFHYRPPTKEEYEKAVGELTPL